MNCNKIYNNNKKLQDNIKKNPSFSKDKNKNIKDKDIVKSILTVQV